MVFLVLYRDHMYRTKVIEQSDHGHLYIYM